MSEASLLVDLGVAQATVVTTCVILMTWLGLMGRPSRATLLWTLGYFFALLGVYVSFTSAAMGIDVVRHPVGQAIGFGLPLLLWSGIRDLGGLRPYAPAGAVQAVVSVAVVALTTQSPIGPDVFRWVVLGAALSTGAVAVAALQAATRSSRFTPPLVAAAVVMVLIGIVGVTYPTVSGGTAGSDAAVTFTRTAIIASMVFLIVATVSLLFFANRRVGARDILDALDAFMPQPLMRGIVRERLLRISARSESEWTLIEIRIDDVDDLREAGSEWSFAQLTDAFEARVIAEFPAECDLARIKPGYIQVFASHSTVAAREHVRNLINRISADSADATATLRLSASAGIVPTAPGDSYDALNSLVGEAADEAQRQGGDRWVRHPSRSVPASS
ncbi:hypothetical protein ACWPKO_25465 (plasmid) [Coraliomargarita sp. W4R53]